MHDFIMLFGIAWLLCFWGAAELANKAPAADENENIIEDDDDGCH